MAYQDTYYVDTNGALHWLSAQDQENAVAQGLPLPDPSWTVATQTEIDAVASPQTATLAGAQAYQIGIIQAAAVMAEQADLSFTTAGGTTANFGMGADQQRKYLGAYTRYVVHAVALPSGFSFIDTGGEAVAFTESDIDSFSTAGFDQVETALNKAASLISQINAATTIEDVQAITW